MIAVENVFGAAIGDGVVAAVADDLEPRFEIPADGSEAADHVTAGSATRHAGESSAAEEFD